MMTTISAERFVETDGIALCHQEFGRPDVPAVLLIGGNAASMLWWDDEFCLAVAAAGRYVIRYDHRDTGRSTGYPDGSPGYTTTDLAEDALAVLSAAGVDTAHLVGVSMGGLLAQDLAVHHPEPWRSLTLMSTGVGAPGTDGLPPIAPELLDYFGSDESPRSPVDALVAGCRAMAGTGQFDAAYVHELAERDLARAGNVHPDNHSAMTAGPDPVRVKLSGIAVPTLVLHGTDDPLFVPEHARILADEIPASTVSWLADTGHVYMPPSWRDAAAAIIAHTAR